MPVILISKIYYTILDEEYEKLALQVAQEMESEGEWLWKIWAMNREEKVATTVYLFNDRLSAKESENWIHMMGTLYGDMVDKVEAQIFDVLVEPSLLNKAPLFIEYMKDSDIMYENITNGYFQTK
jgi:hypothetical protein